MSASPYLRLPLSFDLARMRAEVDAIAPSQWIAHFNTNAYENGWSCVPLRSAGGSASHIMPLDDAKFADTALLAQCPYLRQVIDSFACEKTSVRLMALAPGAIIKAHRDHRAALQDGLARLHVPIRTSAAVLFTIDGEAVHFTAGQAWYLDASCRHAVHNRGTEPRVHLILDCVVNDWIDQLCRAAGLVAAPAPAYGDPGIDDRNVLEIVALLRGAGGVAATALADRLGAAYRSRHMPPV